MAYDNTNSGALFKNEKKKSEKSPDFTGKVNVDGKEFRLAGWFTHAKSSGLKFISLKVSEPDENYQGRGSAEAADDAFQQAGKSDW